MNTRRFVNSALLAAMIAASTAAIARADIVSFPVSETAVMDGTPISTPITFDASNYGFSGTLAASPAGFSFTIAFSSVSGLTTTPMQVYLTDIPLPTSNLPFTNGCLSSPADCVHESAWTFSTPDSSGPTGTITSATFTFTSSADAATVRGWANSSNIFLALAGSNTDLIGTCGSPCSVDGLPRTTLTLISDVAAPEPGTAGLILLGAAAAVLARKNAASRSQVSGLAEDLKR